MFSIAFSLLGGWILSLFGFQGVVIAGMAQLFGVALNTLGYYFLFGGLGAIKSLVILAKRPLIKTGEKKDSIKETLEHWSKNSKK